LPHVIRLFSPDSQKVDGKLNYFRQLFALHQPDPEQSCLLIKGRDRLLACAHLSSLNQVQPGLVFMNFAADKGLTPQVWEDLWQQCCTVAGDMIQGSATIRTAVSGSDLPRFFQSAGFTVVREQVELHAQLGQLPPIQESGFGDFSVFSLAEQPALEDQWQSSFNSGLTTLWDIPAVTSETIQRLRKAPGYDPSAFRLGLDGGEPVSSLFYTVVDSRLGIVRINAAATPSAKRSKGYGRRMLKDTINHLEQHGFTSAIIYTDAANLATNLLFKMLGFRPLRNVKILETTVQAGKISPQSVRPQPVPVPSKPEPLAQEEVAATEEESQETAPKKPDYGFFPGFHTAFNGKKRDE
jgi:ribosomal protein S18 acetylase RimI-like enzyme